MASIPDLLGTSNDIFQVGLNAGQKTLKFGDRGTINWNPSIEREVSIPDKDGVVRIDEATISSIIAYKGAEQTFVPGMNFVTWETIVSSSGIIADANKINFTIQSAGIYFCYAGVQFYEVNNLRRVIIDIMINSNLGGRLVDLESGNVAVFSTLYGAGSNLLSLSVNDIVSIRVIIFTNGASIKNYYNASDSVLNQIKLFKLN